MHITAFQGYPGTSLFRGNQQSPPRNHFIKTELAYSPDTIRFGAAHSTTELTQKLASLYTGMIPAGCDAVGGPFRLKLFLILCNQAHTKGNDITSVIEGLLNKVHSDPKREKLKQDLDLLVEADLLERNGEAYQFPEGMVDKIFEMSERPMRAGILV